ncbi:hypothetical protein ABPG74_015205 [Tetrahymena malaccensis]
MKQRINILFQGNQVKYYFARAFNKGQVQKDISQKLNDKKKKAEEQKKIEGAVLHDKESRKEKDSEEIDQLFMAKCHLDVQRFPEKALKRAQQVFSKYPHKELREMGVNFMKMYQQLHAVEKPSDITQTELFANTDQLLQSSENPEQIIYLRGSAETQEEMDEKVNLKRKQKAEKASKNKDQEAAQEQDQNSTEQDSNDLVDLTKDEPKFKSNANNNIKLNLFEYTQNSAVAYLLRKAPHTFSVACRILTEVRYRMPNFNPQTFLDFGAGLGSGSLAFQDIFPECKNIVACEPSKNMRKLGKHMTQDISNLVYVENLAQTISLPYAVEFDIVFISHVLQEVPSVEARKLIIDSLWGKVKKGGIMIFVENGTPKGFRFAHDFRRYILENKKSDDPYIVAPCPHQGPCPLAAKADTWCHFEQKVGKYPKSVFSKLPTEKQFDNEKFCFMVIQKGVKQEDRDEDNAQTYAEKSFFWDRIIFPIMRRSKHFVYDLCTRDGDFERRVTSKSHGDDEYRTIKKLSWGDLWPFFKRIPNKFRKEGPKGPRLW